MKDLLELMQEKRFLGQEFLTWVWFMSEINSGLIDLAGFGGVETQFDERLVLESGIGETRQVVTCQGKDLDLIEARTALTEGKKVSQARIRLNSDGREWRLTIKAEGLDLTSIRPPKTFEPDEEEAEGAAGKLLDRLALTQELLRALDALYRTFLTVRLSPDWENQTLPRLRRWLSES